MIWAFTLTTINFITNGLIAVQNIFVFGVLSRSVSAIPHHFSGNSTPKSLLTTPYFNRYRGKPAISKFDKPFTPNHRSSQNISTFTSSVLHYFLRQLQPAHG
jgi:hypothetical protein